MLQDGSTTTLTRRWHAPRRTREEPRGQKRVIPIEDGIAATIKDPRGTNREDALPLQHRHREVTPPLPFECGTAWPVVPTPSASRSQMNEAKTTSLKIIATADARTSGAVATRHQAKGNELKGLASQMTQDEAGLVVANDIRDSPAEEMQKTKTMETAR
eukprot:6082540-Amphidinium_carterae.1